MNELQDCLNKIVGKALEKLKPTKTPLSRVSKPLLTPQIWWIIWRPLTHPTCCLWVSG